jgi:altronate dehydratase small subunit
MIGEVTLMSLALRIHHDDNVATLLEDAGPGPVRLLGETTIAETIAVEAISRGHKMALAPLSTGTAVIKYGVAIGRTTGDIPTGAWVHTHNCASPLDPRSTTLDRHTGAPTDTKYE